jgi:hypothetical protein
MLGEFQEWYGWFVTCLTCGTQWDGGEMLRRSTAFGAQREIVKRAKARIRAAKEGS